MIICDECENKKFHPAGGRYAVAEGNDDPFAYWYCKKGHWDGEGEPEPGEPPEPWINCKDFEEKGND